MRQSEFDSFLEEEGLRPFFHEGGPGRQAAGKVCFWESDDGIFLAATADDVGEIDRVGLFGHRTRETGLDEAVRQLVVLNAEPDRPVPVGRCPVCGELTYRGVFALRYPEAVCGSCQQRATCLAHGLPVELYERGLRINDLPPTGSLHRDGSPCPETDRSSTVAIDGSTYGWQEGRFGGTVVQPLPVVVRVVRTKAGWRDRGPFTTDVRLDSATAGRATVADLERALRPEALGLGGGRSKRLWSIALAFSASDHVRQLGVLDLHDAELRLLWTGDPSYELSGDGDRVEVRLEPLGRTGRLPDLRRVVLYRDEVHAGDSAEPIELVLPDAARTYAELGRALGPGSFPSVAGGSTWVLHEPYGDARAVGVLDLPDHGPAGRPARVLWAVDPATRVPSALRVTYLGGRQDPEATLALIAAVPARVLRDYRLSRVQVERWRRRHGDSGAAPDRDV